MNNDQQNINMLFYTHKTKTCRDLLVLLRNENLIGNFKLICVDNMLDKLPQDMIVPTMILVNVNKPLIANEIFAWIEQIKFMRQQQLMDINRKIIQSQTYNNQQLTNNRQTGPVSYDNDIMSGISDKFAFTKIDEPIPHAYFGLGDEDKNIIFTAPQDRKDTIDKVAQNNLIEELESKRMQQDNHFNTEMKKAQITAVMNMEQENMNYNMNYNKRN